MTDRQAPKANGDLRAGANSIENPYLAVSYDRDGRITRLYDKVSERDIIEKDTPGNLLQLFEDRPHLHDAWDFDHNFERDMSEPKTATAARVTENGPVRTVVRVVRNTERSTITQDITLYANTPRLEFATSVDWHEKHVLLKAAFPVSIRSSRATYEIQYGAIERPTHHNTLFDRARFENTALRWVDLSEGDYGVSLVNDCKYGHDVKENVLRISLLRSSVDPDPTADQGAHQFTYAIYPHMHDWRNDTVQQGLELNTPFVVCATTAHKGDLSPVLSFASVDAENVIVDWIKKAEDSNALIIRLYEAYGQRGPVTITFGQRPAKVTECDLMEEKDKSVTMKGNSVTLSVTPYELRTLKVVFS